MNTGMLKRLSLLGSLGLFWAALVSAQTSNLTATQIIEKSRNRIQRETVSTRARMVITAKDGSTTERLVDQYSSYTGGRSRTVVVFQKPASVAGTRFLTIENPGKEEDRWIFLPSLGKVRRIAGSEGSGSFVGTDFSYDDISSADRKADKDTHQLLRQETYNGRPCYVIESRPIDPSYQYARIISWIDTETFIAYKMELYNKKSDKPIKLFEVLKVEDKQGRLTPVESRMTSLQKGTSTTIYVDIIKYDDPIPEGVFTTRFLETGRP